MSILYFAQLIKEAGFPRGMVNILKGLGKEAGVAIASHLDIDKNAFTESTATGRQIMKRTAINLNNIILETGKKRLSILSVNADPDRNVRWRHAGIMSNIGQICTATSRVLVEESIYDEFVRLCEKQVKEVLCPRRGKHLR